METMRRTTRRASVATETGTDAAADLGTGGGAGAETGETGTDIVTEETGPVTDIVTEETEEIGLVTDTGTANTAADQDSGHRGKRLICGSHLYGMETVFNK